MTLRENLLEDFDNLVGEYRASRQETRRTLNKYAIGKWVPVSERLPEDGELVMAVSYSMMPCMTVFQEGRHFVSNESGRTFIGVTKWLELDIPEVEKD